jgi:hypothetical protein
VITKAAIACVLVVGAAAALQTYRLRGAELELVNQRVDWMRESAKAVQASIDEGTRRTAAVQKEVEHARKKVKALEGVAAGAAVAGRGLRDDLAAARARACTTDSTTPSGSAAARFNALSDDLFREMEELGRGMAEEADRRRIAGLACEGSYRALTP